jgi:hypothetical protein
MLLRFWIAEHVTGDNIGNIPVAALKAIKFFFHGFAFKWYAETSYISRFAVFVLFFLRTQLAVFGHQSQSEKYFRSSRDSFNSVLISSMVNKIWPLSCSSYWQKNFIRKLGMDRHQNF